jgi:hypothetical protein
VLQSNPDSKLRNAFVTIRLPDLSQQILQNVAGEGNGRGSAESLRGLWSSVLSANLISFAFDRQCLSKVYTMTLHDSPPTAGNDYYSHYSSFSDPPSCLLPPHFNGREEELDCIARTFATVHGSTPTRFCLFAMAGMGKTQVALKYATMSYGRGPGTIFPNLLDVRRHHRKAEPGAHEGAHTALVGHSDRDHPDQTARLKLRHDVSWRSPMRMIPTIGFSSWTMLTERLSAFSKNICPARMCMGTYS